MRRRRERVVAAHGRCVAEPRHATMEGKLYGGPVCACTRRLCCRAGEAEDDRRDDSMMAESSAGVGFKRSSSEREASEKDRLSLYKTIILRLLGASKISFFVIWTRKAKIYSLFFTVADADEKLLLIFGIQS